MTQQTIGIGTTANDGTGDPARTAFGKVNDNFDELYGVSHTNAVAEGADNTGSTATQAAINAALTAINAAGGGTLYLPSGIYKITSPIVVPSNCRLLGAGIGQTIIRPPAGALTSYLGIYASVCTAGADHVVIEGITVDHVTNATTANGIALMPEDYSTASLAETSTPSTYIVVRHCAVLGNPGAQYLLWNRRARHVLIENCYIDGGNASYVARPGSTQEGIECFTGYDVTIRKNTVKNVENAGILVQSSSGNTNTSDTQYNGNHFVSIEDNYVESCGDGIYAVVVYANSVVDGSTPMLGVCEGLKITGNMLVDNHVAGIYLGTSASTSPAAPAGTIMYDGVVISGNTVKSRTTSATNRYCIRINVGNGTNRVKTRNVLIANNLTEGGNKAGIALSSVTDATITGNSISDTVSVSQNGAEAIGIRGALGHECENILISGNQVHRAADCAMTIVSSFNVRVDGNRFAWAYVTDSTGIQLGASSGTANRWVTISNNNFRSHASQTIYSTNGTAAYNLDFALHGNWLETSAGRGAFSGDPTVYTFIGYEGDTDGNIGVAVITSGSSSVTVSGHPHLSVATGKPVPLAVYQMNEAPLAFRVTVTDGQFVITTASAVAADTSFRWMILN